MMPIDTPALLLPDGRDGALVKPQNCKLCVIYEVSYLKKLGTL